jgi:hypothetical protein
VLKNRYNGPHTPSLHSVSVQGLLDLRFPAAIAGGWPAGRALVPADEVFFARVMLRSWEKCGAVPKYLKRLRITPYEADSRGTE